ncbi:MAG: hypothetical protein EBQ89_07180 [Alphaproteobacteria bacterium]|nr:hypothetical protein [Alphaproteobacteria bacterium]NDG20033.1 hypothetical protein [Betaproteobacteria bacterium]
MVVKLLEMVLLKGLTIKVKRWLYIWEVNGITLVILLCKIIDNINQRKEKMLFIQDMLKI